MICQNCGQEFEALENVDGLECFCSHECWWNAWSRRGESLGKSEWADLSVPGEEPLD